MKVTDIIRMCFRNLLKRKMRTTLTILGVVIGTCTIVVMVSLGVGMDDAMDKMVNEWADLTLIQVYNYNFRGAGQNLKPDGTEIPDITDEQIKIIKDIPHIRAVTPFMQALQIGEQVAIYSATDELAVGRWSSSFIGVYMDEMENFGFKLLEGRFKEAGDPSGTVLVGQNFGTSAYDYVFEEDIWLNWPEDYDDDFNPIRKLFDPMKAEMRIIPLSIDTSDGFWVGGDFSVIGSATAPHTEHDRELKVVGVLEGDQRDWYTMGGVFVDMEFLNYYIKAFNDLNPDFQYQEFDGTYNHIRVRVDDMNNVPKVEAALKEMGYETWSAGEARENMRQQVQLIQMLLAGLAAISLFVAALNITNTMVTAVIERTREIGIMKVLGCDLYKIMALFLGEAALIGFIGGLVGVGASYGISALFNNFLFEQILTILSGGAGQGFIFEEEVVISQIPILLALGGLLFATFVGVVSGIYPAFRGTRISALSAIAYE